MNLNILFVDDDDKIRTNLVKIFDKEVIEGHTLITSGASTFEEGMNLVIENDYDIVILDLYKGEPIDGNEKLGLDILKQIPVSGFCSSYLLFWTYKGFSRYRIRNCWSG